MHTNYNVYGLGFWIEKLSVSMVELRGIEPRTSWMQIKRSPSWAIAPYWSHVIKTLVQIDDLVGLGRLELPTSPLSGVRSNQLSYRPIVYATNSRMQLTACSFLAHYS